MSYVIGAQDLAAGRHRGRVSQRDLGDHGARATDREYGLCDSYDLGSLGGVLPLVWWWVHKYCKYLCSQFHRRAGLSVAKVSDLEGASIFHNQQAVETHSSDREASRPERDWESERPGKDPIGALVGSLACASSTCLDLDPGTDRLDLRCVLDCRLAIVDIAAGDLERNRSVCVLLGYALLGSGQLARFVLHVGDVQPRSRFERNKPLGLALVPASEGAIARACDPSAKSGCRKAEGRFELEAERVRVLCKTKPIVLSDLVKNSGRRRLAKRRVPIITKDQQQHLESNPTGTREVGAGSRSSGSQRGVLHEHRTRTD